MYDLYQPLNSQAGGGFEPGELRRVRDGLRRSIERVRLYRTINPMYLENRHPLLRILQGIPVSLSLPPDIFVDRVADYTYPLARQQGFATPVSPGRVWTPGVFYGTGVDEMIMANSEPFSLQDIENTWPDLQPVRVIYHPLSDLRLHVPDGKYSNSEPGMAVIDVNVPMLMLQYRMWRNWERGHFPTEQPRNLGQFLMAHPLPNMLYSHLDCAIANRIANLEAGRANSTQSSRHPFVMEDLTAPLDNVARMFIKAMQGRRQDIDSVVAHMPTVGLPSRYDTLRLPDVPFTYQIVPAILMARLEPLLFSLRMAAYPGMPADSMIRSQLDRFFRKLKNMNIIDKSYPEPLRARIKDLIDNKIQPLL